ncbi:MAG: hypothetical protein U0570_08900 [Phycisphaerales bacterium]
MLACLHGIDDALESEHSEVVSLVTACHETFTKHFEFRGDLATGIT